MSVTSAKRPTYSAWFIVSDGFILVHDTQERWKRLPKRGIAQNAMSFRTRAEAELEIDTKRSLGFWPGYMHKAEPREISWR